MRKFYLENELGERLSLAQQKALWLNKPSGLGMASAASYAAVRPGFYSETADAHTQATIGGTLVFCAEDTGEQFQRVTDWMLRAAALCFVYEPTQGKQYYRDVDVRSIDKSEKTLHRLLECNVAFIAKTPWYNRYSHRFQFEAESFEGEKRYGYRYPYRYAAAFQPMSVDFQIEGHYPGEVELLAEGPFSAPVLTLANTQTGEVYGRLNLHELSVQEGQLLQYSSKTTDPGVWLVTGEKREDVVDFVELRAGEPSFFHVPANVPVTATLRVEGTDSVAAKMHVVQYYRVR